MNSTVPISVSNDMPAIVVLTPMPAFAPVDKPVQDGIRVAAAVVAPWDGEADVVSSATIHPSTFMPVTMAGERYLVEFLTPLPLT